MVSNRTFSLCVCAFFAASTLCHSEQISELKGKKIPFKLFGNYLIVVEGSIGELKKKNFLIDTGTNPSIVDVQIAQQLQLSPLTNMPDTLPVINGGVRAQFAVLPSLRFGPIHRESIPVVIQNLSSFRDKVGTRIDAVVGLDVLGQSSFRIDYGRKQILFGSLEVTSSTVPFLTGPPFVTVALTIENRRVTLLIDTGTAGLVIFANRLGALPQNLAQLGMASTSGLAGSIHLPVRQISGAILGSREIGIREIYLAAESGCCSFDGLMGISSARMKQIGFDFERRLFTWQLQDAAIPTMSEAHPDTCLPASTPGLVPRSEASMGSFPASVSGCGIASVSRGFASQSH